MSDDIVSSLYLNCSQVRKLSPTSGKQFGRNVLVSIPFTNLDKLKEV